MSTVNIVARDVDEKTDFQACIPGVESYILRVPLANAICNCNSNEFCYYDDTNDKESFFWKLFIISTVLHLL